MSSVKEAVARIQEALNSNHAPAPADLEMVRSINVESVRSELGSPGGLDKVTRLVLDFARRWGLNSEELHQRVARYETTAWPRERTYGECPARHAGRAEAICWEILRIYGRTPAARTIRRMLEEQSCGHVKARDGRDPPFKLHRS